MTLPRKVKNLREQYLAKRTHIKIAEKLCAEIQKEMQESCPHPILIHFLYERDKGNSACRMCWVCGSLEEGRAITKRGYISGWKFMLLTAKPFTSLRAPLSSVDRIMATPAADLLEELAKIQLEYVANS